MKKRTATVLKWVGLIIIALGILYLVLLGTGNRSLRRAYAALEADGRPMKAEQIIPASIPDPDNAALVYQAVVLQLKAEKAGEKDLFTELGAAAITVVKETTNVEVKAQFRQLSQTRAASEALAALQRGTAKPGCRYDRSYSSVASFDNTYIIDLRTLSRILGALALQQAEDGAHATSWQTTLCCLRLANATRNEPLLISQLVRSALFSQANDTVHAIAKLSPPSSQQVEELDGALKDFESTAPFVSALDGERLLLGEWAFNLQAAEVRKGVFGDAGKASIRRAIGWGLLSSPLSLYDHAAYLTIMRGYAKTATESYSLEEAKRLEAQIMELHWYNIMTCMLVPALSATKARILSMNADARITRVGLALLKHRQAKGAFPNDLRDLGMGDLLDPFTAKPLIYKVTPSGFILYSVGENLADDKGTASQNKHSGDIVWQYSEKSPPRTARE